jgi:hypothetical protein
LSVLRDKKVVGVFVRFFSCAASISLILFYSWFSISADEWPS